jgi:hypothetical protein
MTTVATSTSMSEKPRSIATPLVQRPRHGGSVTSPRKSADATGRHEKAATKDRQGCWRFR